MGGLDGRCRPNPCPKTMLPPSAAWGCLYIHRPLHRRPLHRLPLSSGLPGITGQQKDEVRSLRREIDHDINNDGLLSKIVKEFPNKPDPVPVQTKDFAHLRCALCPRPRPLRSVSCR